MHIFARLRRLSRLQVMVIVIGTLFLLAMVGFLGRGIWRSNILPAYALMRYGDNLVAVHRAEAIKINKALEPLGLTVGNGETTASCNLDIAVVWRTSISCATADSWGTPHVFTPLPSATDASVQQVQTSLERDGWRGGIDTSGGLLLYYDKTVEGFDCALQLWVRGGQEVAPRLFCYQTYYYLGSPY